MIKFVDILKEQEEIIQVPKLDTRANRKLMNIISKKFDFDYYSNSPKSLRRYLIELYGQGAVAERSLKNIPEEKTNKDGVRVWRIK